MDVTTDHLIDIGLQIAGFLAGGAFWAIITWKPAARATNRKHAGTVTVSTAAAASAAAARAVNRLAERADVIDLTSSAPVPERSAGSMRTRRLETLAMAKDLLARGSTNERIQQLVSVSDGELAMLRLQQPVPNRRAS